MAPEHAEQRMALAPEDGQHGSQDQCRGTQCAPGNVKKHVNHQDVRHDGQHQSRAEQCSLSEQQQRTAGKLDRSEKNRIDMGITVVEPGKLIAAERS